MMLLLERERRLRGLRLSRLSSDVQSMILDDVSSTMITTDPDEGGDVGGVNRGGGDYQYEV